MAELIDPRVVAHEILLLTLLAEAPEGAIERFLTNVEVYTDANLYDAKVSDAARERLQELAKGLAARARLWRSGA